MQGSGTKTILISVPVYRVIFLGVGTASRKRNQDMILERNLFLLL
jgi:hypothetical protein